MIASPLALWAFMFVLIALARGLEARFEFVRKISSAVVCTLLGIALANLGIIPHQSVAYEAVNTYAIPYAIVLVILASNLRDLRVAGGPMVLCFLVAVVGSFIGGTVAGLTFASWIGPETWKLSGQFAGAFAGGGMNFVAIGRELETTPDLFAAAAVADNLSTVPWMLTQIALYSGLARHYASLASAETIDAARAREETERARRQWSTTEVSLSDLAWLAALPLGILWLADLMAPVLPGFPEVLWLTSFALIVAQLRPTRRLKGAAVMSYFALHLFFIVIGASSVVSEVLRAGMGLFVFMIAIIAIHAVIVYVVGWLARFDLATVTIASQAAVGGPGSALALAMSMRWPSLVAPGIIVGIFGYAIGNYSGFLCAYLLRSLG